MMPRRIFSIIVTAVLLRRHAGVVLARKDDQVESTTSSSKRPFRVFKRKNRAVMNRADNLSAPTLSPTSIPCPPSYDPHRTDYFAGDVVEVANEMYICRPSPYEKYCGISTLEQLHKLLLVNDGDEEEHGVEDEVTLWRTAWLERGECGRFVTTSAPTSMMTDDPLEPAGMLSSSAPTSMVTDDPLVPAEILSSSAPSVTPSVSSLPSISLTPSTSLTPSEQPSTLSPTMIPTSSPTWYPTTQSPTYFPTTWHPTYSPTSLPTDSPSGGPTMSPTTDGPTTSPTNRPSYSPTSSPLAISPSANELVSAENITCVSSEQIHLRIELVTDNYPKDISWQFIDRSNNVILLASPTDGYSGVDLGDGKMESQVDIRDICLDSTTAKTNKYEFILKDSYGDGLCCRNGIVSGHYKLLQYGDENDEWTVLVSGSNFKSKVVQHYFEFYVPALEQSVIFDEGDIQTELFDIDFDGTRTTPTAQLELICPPPQRKITIQIKTDDFGADTSWEFRVKNGSILAKNEQAYANRQAIYNRDVCVEDNSLYELTVNDAYGDGMCCAYKAGHYKILAHNQNLRSGGIMQQGQETILYGGRFHKKKITHLINTTKPYMSERDMDWLNEHNTRRKYWHPYYNTTYIPLLWSESLKAEAKVWADTLLDACEEGAYHDPQRIFGENAASNVGSGSWGTRRAPGKIVTRFVEYELNWAWPENGHLTQVLWRASKYVGCADSHKDLGGGRDCHTQVCRYARTGNCNMGAFKGDDGIVDYTSAMLEDVNYCGPICPLGGCHA